jgi:hypothetical protein
MSTGCEITNSYRAPHCLDIDAVMVRAERLTARNGYGQRIRNVFVKARGRQFINCLQNILNHDRRLRLDAQSEADYPVVIRTLSHKCDGIAVHDFPFRYPHAANRQALVYTKYTGHYHAGTVRNFGAYGRCCTSAASTPAPARSVACARGRRRFWYSYVS